MYYMMTDRGKSNRTVHALAARVGIWVVLFAFIAIGVGTGFIKPSGSLTPRQKAENQSTNSESAADSEPNNQSVENGSNATGN